MVKRAVVEGPNRNVREAADWLGISTRTLQALIARGKIAVTRVSTRRIVIAESDLRAYCESVRTPACR